MPISPRLTACARVPLGTEAREGGNREARKEDAPPWRLLAGRGQIEGDGRRLEWTEPQTGLMLDADG